MSRFTVISLKLKTDYKAEKHNKNNQNANKGEHFGCFYLNLRETEVVYKSLDALSSFTHRTLVGSV